MRNSWGRRGGKKYNNQAVKYDGFTFGSETEYNRYLQLKDRAHSGEIIDLEVHPAFWLEFGGVRIFERPFHPDFKYRLAICPSGKCLVDRDSFRRRREVPDPEESTLQYWCQQCCRVEDTKGYMDPSDLATQIFNAKCRLMEAIYGIEVKVVQTLLTQRRQERAQANKKEKRRLQQLALKMENDQPNDRRRKQS